MNIREEKWGVIVNPYAGTRKLKKDWPKIYRLLKKAEIEFSVQNTEYVGHATILARKFVELDFRYILVIGGDGTLNEVVNGIYASSIKDKQNVSLALIPYGTGNDWARYWGLLNSQVKLKEVLYNRNKVKVDIGCMEFTNRNGEEDKRFFINGSGLGFDGVVVNITDKLKQVFGGRPWVYSLSIFLSVFAYKPTQMKLTADDGECDKSIFTISIGNSCYSGGGLKQTPQANPTDGVFHITAIEKPSLWKIIVGLKSLFSGKLDKHPCANNFVTTQFVVKTEDTIIGEVDGIKIEGKGEYKITIIPKALNMIV